MARRKAAIKETFADWLTLKDANGTFFKVDRLSNLELSPDCLDRLDSLINSVFKAEELAVLFTVRACVVEIQRLQVEAADKSPGYVAEGWKGD